jgi:hypothetical protein
MSNPLLLAESLQPGTLVKCRDSQGRGVCVIQVTLVTAQHIAADVMNIEREVKAGPDTYRVAEPRFVLGHVKARPDSNGSWAFRFRCAKGQWMSMTLDSILTVPAPVPVQ